ncbi:unnamed protein product, partial [Prorocentrum cordatum]
VVAYEDENRGKLGAKQAFRGIYLMSRPFYCGDHACHGKVRAWFLSLSCSLWMIGTPRFLLWNSELVSRMFAALSHGPEGEAEFNKVTKLLAVYIVCSVLARAIEELLKGMWALEWRKFLTRRLLRSYVTGNVFYTLKLEDAAGVVDNPDQRICQDVDEFTQSAVGFMSYLIGVISTIIMASMEIFRAEANLYWAAIVYAILYNVFMFNIFGGRLMRLRSKKLEQEADLRYSVIRVRESAEAIAFYQGAEYERMKSSGHFDDVVTTSYRELFMNSVWRGIDTGNGNITYFMPYWVLSHGVFAGTMSYEDAIQIQILTVNLMGALVSLVGELARLSTIAAHSARVLRLQEELDLIHRDADEDAHDSDDDSSESSTEDPSRTSPLASLGKCKIARHETPLDGVPLEMDNVTLRCPGPEKSIVLKDVSLTLEHGSSLLVTGPSGTGKSCLLRAIAGLWRRGTGLVSCCPHEQCFFLSQSGYICPGSLWDNVAYPVSGVPPEAFEDGGAFSRSEVTRVLRALDLQHLLDKHGLDRSANLDVLSGGEKQRLAFSRVLMRPHMKLVLLDEATSAVGEDMECRMYAELRRRGLKTYVSVGHRPTLARFHSHKVEVVRYADDFQPNTRLIELGDPDGDDAGGRSPRSQSTLGLRLPARARGDSGASATLSQYPSLASSWQP